MAIDPLNLELSIASLRHHGPARLKTARELVRLSETQPALLEPYFDELAELLDSDNKIIQWNALKIVSNLACTDPDRPLDSLLSRYLAPISGPVMITAGIAMAGAAKIAHCRKELSPRIVRAILQVEHATFKTMECRHIATGHAISALAALDAEVRRSPRVLEFVRRQVESPRPATRRKASAFLKKNEDRVGKAARR